MTITRLVFVASEDAPWPYLRATPEGEVLQRGVIPPGSPRPDTDDVDRLVTPGAESAARWLELADRNDAQARSAVGFLLQNDLLDDGEALHVAVGPGDADGRRIAVLTRPDAVRRWLEQARARGIEPASLTPDYLMLPEPEDDVLVTAGFGDLTAVRGRNLAFALEPSLAQAVIGDRPSRRLSIRDLEPALALGAATPPLDLLQGRFGAKAASMAAARPKRAATMAVVLLLSPLLLMVAGIARDHLMAQAAEDRIAARLEAAYPGTARGADPVASVQARLDQMRRADRFPDLAAGLFAVLEKSPGAQLDTLSYAEDGALRARVAYSNYSDVDQLVAAGRALGLEIRPDSTVTEGARVTSELIVTRKAP